MTPRRMTPRRVTPAQRAEIAKLLSEHILDPDDGFCRCAKGVGSAHHADVIAELIESWPEVTP